jgi:microcystin-dependent protein
MSFWKWSRTASSNATADTSINWAEGQAPSTVNDSGRAMMAAAAKFRDDISGAITTGGSSTAYTVTSYQAFDSLANMNGAMIAFTPHTTSGATVTLNVDGLGAKPLRFAPGAANELPAGTLVQGTPYVATYYNATTEWILQGLAGNPYNIPLGGMIEFTGTTAPNGSFVLPFGQAISRSIYAAYFAMVGTTYGAGDGSTFNVIDKRGRVSAGKDDMGGTSANRLTNQSGGLNGDTLGAAGGSETHTLTLAESAAHDHGGQATGTLNFNTHVRNIDAATGAVAVPVHATSATAGDQNWFVNNGILHFGGTAPPSDPRTIASAGGGGAHNNTQPTIIVNYILRVL